EAVEILALFALAFFPRRRQSPLGRCFDPAPLLVRESVPPVFVGDPDARVEVVAGTDVGADGVAHLDDLRRRAETAAVHGTELERRVEFAVGDWHGREPPSFEAPDPDLEERHAHFEALAILGKGRGPAVVALTYGNAAEAARDVPDQDEIQFVHDVSEDPCELAAGPIELTGRLPVVEDIGEVPEIE